VRLEGSDEPVDLYFKVEPKSRKQKDKSLIYLLVNKVSEGFINSGADYSAAQRFLNGFLEQSAGYKLDLDIKAQESTLKDAQKKLTKLQDDEKSINKKIEQLQSDLKKNQQDQENQQKSIESEQKKLEELKTGKSS
jgi:peptidoglycan hydrolase CwlO-like protein